MKYLTLIILFLLMGLKSFGQFKDYPQYYLDSAGNKVGVIFSIQQAQKIDNDYDLMEIMKKMQLGSDSLIKSYKIVVADLNQVIAVQDVKINQQDSLNTKNTEIIDNLNNQIRGYIQTNEVNQQLLSNKNKEIGLKDKQIFKLKAQKIAGFTLTTVFGAVTIGGIIYFVVVHH